MEAVTPTPLVLRELPEALRAGLLAGTLAPYLGPGMLSLCAGATPPADTEALAAFLAARSTVPGKLRRRLSAAAQFIENFKHRKTLVQGMDAAYGVHVAPSPLHRWLAALRAPLIVHAWYDDALRGALAAHGDWAEVQARSQAEHSGSWFGWYDASGAPSPQCPDAATVLYRPWGGRSPASNYLVSDSDHVEVLTEIDIQTPIPLQVQQRRVTLGFVFLGCRFDDQLPRVFARQILKRSRGPHYAVLPHEPTRMEARFLAEQDITRIALPLADVAAQLVAPELAVA